MTKKVGFCAVHSQDTGEYARWAILEDWQRLGEHTLAWATQMVDDGIAASTAKPEASKDELVQELLIALVVDAAVRMDVKTIPCRSSALMQHLGWPCFLIDIGDPVAITARAIETTSWQEADEMIDQMEAAAGNCYARIRSEGDQVSILMPLDGPALVPPTAH